MKQKRNKKRNFGLNEPAGRHQILLLRAIQRLKSHSEAMIAQKEYLLREYVANKMEAASKPASQSERGCTAQTSSAASFSYVVFEFLPYSSVSVVISAAFTKLPQPSNGKRRA